MKQDSRLVYSTSDGDQRKARGVIEIRAGHRVVVVEILTAEGYHPILAGG